MRMLLPILVLLPASVLAFEPGQKVLARFEGGPAWFSGVVESSDAQGVVVLYHDGDRERRPIDEVRPFDWRVGTPIQCNWDGTFSWVSGEIVEIEGLRLVFRFGEGQELDIPIAFCRSL